MKETQKSLLITIVQCIRSSLVAISSTIMRSRILEIWPVQVLVTMINIKAIGVEQQLMMILKMTLYLSLFKMTISKKRSI
jgi:hypothetical protein